MGLVCLVHGCAKYGSRKSMEWYVCQNVECACSTFFYLAYVNLIEIYFIK